ncbi:MAG: diguanylate cyclase [Proteobacteria bacterium]|nr:diguanylate cyclase [Pseudomonadota bacterium]MBU1139271.1 diguanylate cyclase [Pseudomonadota bacterium]
MAFFKVKGEACVITISAGASVYDPPETAMVVRDMAALIHQADSQLYRAKANGRNRVQASGVASP